MERFTGPRQGLGVWIIGLVVTVVLAAAGALLGAVAGGKAGTHFHRKVDRAGLT